MTVVLGPLPCLTCKRDVAWDRVGSYLRLMEPAGAYLRRHTCRRAPVRTADRCGALMVRIQEPCARALGHADSHRSRYDLANQARARRAGWAA